jgi:phage-related protein
MTWLSLAKSPTTLDPDGELEDAVLRTPFDAGYEQTRPKYTRMRRIWGVRYDELSNADVATLRTYEQTTLVNGANSFTWTHPLSGTFTVRLAGPIKYVRSADKYGVADISFVLREV